MFKINDLVDIEFNSQRYKKGAKVIKRYEHDVFDVELRDKTVIPVHSSFLMPHKPTKSFPSDFKEVNSTGYMPFDKSNEILKEIQDGKIDFYNQGSYLIFKKGNKVFIVDGYWEIELS